MRNIVIIGGGAAGMMAAIAAAESDHTVILLEKNEKLGKKLFITGKGRCNVTNGCETEALFAQVQGNPKFLYSAIYGFDNQAVMRFFEKAGCPLKIERGQRVFPVSDHSSDIIRALEAALRAAGVQIRFNCEVQKINLWELAQEDNGWENKKKKKAQTAEVFGVELTDKNSGQRDMITADSVIVATGGMSYELTGSTGDGYRFAKSCGHTVTPLSPALVPFTVREEWCRSLQGLSLKNVRVTVEAEGKTIYSDFGEMLFTHYGVSGPLILSASSHYVHKLCENGRRDRAAKLFIDLKPALTAEQLDKRILREFEENRNKQFKNAIGSLFPAKLVPLMPMLAEIDPDRKVHDITREERERFAAVIKHMELTITGLRDYDEAVITAGGVAIGEVNPSTMESRLVKGLYFAGEVLDVDALTGGFNLQIAWSTGHLAGESAAKGGD
ncbi:MAG: NAD(P)/FAD-dependent oxidoreductase [Roseburia sp.]|nr:NAD(P)/FAD-dependent oxidoreductase [Roseburia sp.]